MKRGPDYNLVGEHRRAGTVTTVSTSRKGHTVGQARQAGLETRTHPGEAVPCSLLCMQGMQVLQEAQPSEWPFWERR